MTLRSAGDQTQNRGICWRVIEGPSGRLVVCAVYEIADASIELRVGYVDRVLRSERFTDVMSARTRAEEWLVALRNRDRHSI